MQFELTETEAQRYDRQIRVWGAEAQSRIQNSKVLVAGLGKMNVEVEHDDIFNLIWVNPSRFIAICRQLGCEEYCTCWDECYFAKFQDCFV